MTYLKTRNNGLGSLTDEMARFFGDTRGEWAPVLDVVERTDAVEVQVELPGIDPEKVDVSFADDVLEIRGEKTEERTTEDLKWYRFERRAGAFRRALRIGVPVDGDAIEATAKHGVLTIRLPKRAEVLPKRIQIKSE